jgi:hypothetical protein
MAGEGSNQRDRERAEDRRRKLEQWRDECERRSELHSDAARDSMLRNTTLALVAIAFSALVGVPAFVTAAGNTWPAQEQPSQEEQPPQENSTQAATATDGVTQGTTDVALPVQWGIAILALGAAVLNGVQQSPWANPEKTESHRTAAANCGAVAREIDWELASWTKKTNKEKDEIGATLRTNMDSALASAPTLPRKYQRQLPS